MSSPDHLLGLLLLGIEEADGIDYERRNGFVMAAVNRAKAIGLEAGYGVDAPSLGFQIVAYIELPTGQVSWHLPNHEREWDGHSTLTKSDRARRYANGQF